MKYLRKFATKADMADLEQPNVVLIGDTEKVLYNAKIYANGVYIQHIDGRLYTSEEWETKAFANSKANGIAVIDADCSFVLAKEDCGSEKWGSTSILVSGVAVKDSSVVSVSYSDFAGLANTEILVSKGGYPAAQICADYIFPNGSRGYLASAGEWYCVTGKYVTEVSNLLTQIGGAELQLDYWTSTQRNTKNAWGTRYNDSKSKSQPVRAFTTLE